MKEYSFSQYNIPYPKPRCPHGEDVIYVRDNLFLLIDGVGGSSLRMGPPEKWIQCRDYIIEFIETLKYFSRMKKLKLSDLIEYSNRYIASRTKHSGTFVFSACRIHQYEDKKVLEYCTLGDASLVVRRKNQIVLKTKHTYRDKEMNVPRQMGKTMEGDFVYDPLTTKKMLLKSGDIIYLCSDGVTDNISVLEMLKKRSR